MELKELYRDLILDHNRQPRNFGRLDEPARHAQGHNPLCGDRAHGVRAPGRGARGGHPLRGPGLRHLHRLRLAHDRGGQGQGRAPRSRPCTTKVHALLTQQDAPADAALGKLAALSGVREFPARVKCASLCWHTLNAALTEGAATVSTE